MVARSNDVSEDRNLKIDDEKKDNRVTSRSVEHSISIKFKKDSDSDSLRVQKKKDGASFDEQPKGKVVSPAIKTKGNGNSAELDKSKSKKLPPLSQRKVEKGNSSSLSKSSPAKVAAGGFQSHDQKAQHMKELNQRLSAIKRGQYALKQRTTRKGLSSDSSDYNSHQSYTDYFKKDCQITKQVVPTQRQEERKVTSKQLKANAPGNSPSSLS